MKSSYPQPFNRRQWGGKEWTKLVLPPRVRTGDKTQPYIQTPHWAEEFLSVSFTLRHRHRAGGHRRTACSQTLGHGLWSQIQAMWIESWLHQMGTVCPWAGYSTPLSFNFLFYKVGMITIHVPQNCWEVAWLGAQTAHRKYLKEMSEKWWDWGWHVTLTGPELLESKHHHNNNVQLGHLGGSVS